MTASPGPETRWEGTVESPRVRWDQIAVENIAASLAVDGKRIELTRARARAASGADRGDGRWEWAGSGRGHAVLGPVSLAAITGVPPRSASAARAAPRSTRSVERGVASATALVEMDEVSAAGVSLGAGQSEVRVRGRALEGELSFPARRFRAKASGRLEVRRAAHRTSRSTIWRSSRCSASSARPRPTTSKVACRAARSCRFRSTSRRAARGVVRLTPDGLRVLGEPWASQGPIVLRWEGPRVVVERLRLDGPSGSLSVTGALAGPDVAGSPSRSTMRGCPGRWPSSGRGTARAEVRLEGGDFELTRLDAQWPGLDGRGLGPARVDGAIDFTGARRGRSGAARASARDPGMAGAPRSPPTRAAAATRSRARQPCARRGSRSRRPR